MELTPVSFTALILDFDGVIVESTEVKRQAFIEMFGDYPEHLQTIEEYHQKHLGTSRYKKFAWIYKELLKRPLSRERLEELGDRFSEIVVDQIVQAPFVPGALETLRACAIANIPVFVISGTPHDELHRIIDLKGLPRYITEAWGSPHEKDETIRKIRGDYGIESSDMLFVGDGLTDYEAARRERVPFLARESGGGGANWPSWGVPSVPDLTCLAATAPSRPVFLPIKRDAVSERTLTLALREGGSVK